MSANFENLVEEYHFNGRGDHTTAVIGDSLYLWAGNQPGLPSVHDSPEKQLLTSTIQLFSVSSGKWSSHSTTGTPPLGVRGYKCIAIADKLYYFGGWCNHGNCYHNSINQLDASNKLWTELAPTNPDRPVMRRGYGGMITVKWDGEYFLLMIGGYGALPATQLPEADYIELSTPGIYRTNEHSLFNITTGKWSDLSITGDCIAPTSSCVLEQVNNCKAVLFGGWMNDGREFPNTVYINQNQICDQWPVGRSLHSGTIISGITSPLLVTTGGWDQSRRTRSDCWVFDITLSSWTKVPIPQSICVYDHSLSAFVMGPNCVWLVAVGGFDENFQLVNDTNVTFLLELLYQDGQWIMKNILSSTALTSDTDVHIYQQKYLEQLQSGRQEWVAQYHKQKIDEATLMEHVFELKEDLSKEKMAASQLKEALHEQAYLESKSTIHLDQTAKEGSEDRGYSFTKSSSSSELQHILFAETDLNQQKQITAKEPLIMSSTEEPESIIDIETLKAEVAEKDRLISKLIKKQSQDSCTKKTSSVTIQFDYMVPSLDNLSDVHVVGKKLFQFHGKTPQVMNWEQYGLRIGVSRETLSSSDTAEVSVVALIGGQFEFPNNTKLVSAVYAISLSKPLLQPLRLEVQHCVNLTNEAQTKYLMFAIAPVNTFCLPYQFLLVEGGEFTIGSCYGSIFRKEFCLVSIVAQVYQEDRLPVHVEGEGVSDEESGSSMDEHEGGEASLEEEHDESDGETSASSDSSGTVKSKDPPVASTCTSSGSQDQEQSNQQYQRHGQQKDRGNKENEYKDSDKDSDTAISDSKPVNGSFTVSNDVSITTDTSQTQVLINKSHQSTGVVEAMTYAGLVYYEEKRVEDLVTFTATKHLNVLIKYLNNKYSQAEIGQDVYFTFKEMHGFVQLKFNEQQRKPYTGWTIDPQLEPPRLYQDFIDKFGTDDFPAPSRCLISVYGSPTAVPILHYGVLLEGVVYPVTIFIHRASRTTRSRSASPDASGRNDSVDVNHIRQKLKEVLKNNQVALKETFELSIGSIYDELLQASIITRNASLSYNTIIGSFMTGMNWRSTLPDLEEYCIKFLEALSNVGGPVAYAARVIQKEWIEIVKCKLGIELDAVMLLVL